MSILIVENDVATRDLLAGVLREDYPVIAVSSAEEAMEALREFSFRVALVDVNLPGMHGAELVGALNARHPEIAVIVMSGEQVNSGHHWWAMGVFAYLATRAHAAIGYPARHRVSDFTPCC